MNASNNPQVQQNEPKNSWVQDWVDEMIEGHKRMATDENFRQEVARRATGGNTTEEIQAMLKKNIAKHRALKAQTQ